MLCISITTLNGCAWFRKHKHHGSQAHHMPHVTVPVVPGGTSDNWHYLGSSHNVIVEIDSDSVHHNDDNSVVFRDRKTMKHDDQQYKYVISYWQINCEARNYVITKINVYDNHGKNIYNKNFYHTGSNKIHKKTIASMLYTYVCGNNRLLGY
jgi:hypothetical protein